MTLVAEAAACRCTKEALNQPVSYIRTSNLSLTIVYAHKTTASHAFKWQRVQSAQRLAVLVCKKSKSKWTSVRSHTDLGLVLSHCRVTHQSGKTGS